MKLKVKATTLAVTLAVAAAAHAGATGSASFYCTPQYTPAGTATIGVSAEHVGRPGFVAIVAELGSEAAYLAPDGSWIYDRTPFDEEFRVFTSLPASVSVDFCVPNVVSGETGTGLQCTGHTNASTAGASIWVTYGALTPEIEAAADELQQRTDWVNQRLVSMGRVPRPPFDRERYIKSRVIKHAKDNAVSAGVVPFIDCTPPDYGN
jgi:hypothetical protein